ncbi:hypothetical protein MTBPR1_90113 [Candidatus Terasakiella magnetica]|uniref:DUF4384 domain-containing protein n=1 Tax=Candidatus Terasakiella magnetica TaxID=1867952 RepID=A0A1C3RLY0_9PROT|nr:DUF4384 domain-containing protein [Candidatus Terasakiella magnetica]SCA58266.1 hypothetical protein MTBPR1_90113 [Candidatus Terasakiella magnetica]
MKRIAILIATTGGPVLVDRITPEPAPQSMICLQRQSDVLPISADYDDFVRPGSGVIMREFGPYEEGAFRMDVSAAIGTGLSWQLGVFGAHAVFKSETCELSNLENADLIVWLSGTVDYDLNVGDVDHMAEKVESSALLLAEFIAKGTPIIFGAGLENAKFLAEHKPPKGIEVFSLKTTHDLLQAMGLGQRPQDKNSTSFWLMAGVALACVVGLFIFSQSQNDAPELLTPVENDLEITLTSDLGKEPIYYYGDELNLIVSVNQQAWVHCFYEQVNGDILKIYPNDQMDKIEPLSADRIHVLSGAEDSEFVIRLGPPAGEEEVSCFASLDKADMGLEDISDDMPHDTLFITLKP